MLRLIVVACRLLMVQPAEIVKKSEFSAVGCKGDDESEVDHYVLDLCLYKGKEDHDRDEKTDKVDKYELMDLDGKKLLKHFFSDEKCKTDLTVDNKTGEELGTIDKCEEDTTSKDHDGNTTTPNQDVKTSKKFFEKMTGKAYILIHTFDKKGCEKSDRTAQHAVYEIGNCENKEDGTKEKGMSEKVTMDLKSQSWEKKSYSKKDCAGDAMDDKKKTWSVKWSDGCLQYPEDDKVWVKGEVKDFSVDSLLNGTASGAFSMVPSWLGVALVALLWQH